MSPFLQMEAIPLSTWPGDTGGSCVQRLRFKYEYSPNDLVCPSEHLPVSQHLTEPKSHLSFLVSGSPALNLCDIPSRPRDPATPKVVDASGIHSYMGCAKLN